MACPTRGVREFQMPNTSLTSVKMGDQEATRGKVSCAFFCFSGRKKMNVFVQDRKTVKESNSRSDL